MTVNGWLQIALYGAIVVLLVRPLGGFMTRLFTGERTFLSPVLRPVEAGIYRLSGVDAAAEQHWTSYAAAVLIFNAAHFFLLYAMLRVQGLLPFNPMGETGVTPDLAFNTAISFVTNTNWQNYSGETTLGYFIQMAGLTVHNFLSAASGIAVAIAVVRGFSRRTTRTLGNFWVDMTRSVLYILLPLSIVVALFFIWQGMPQNLDAYTAVTTLEGGKQLIAQGPVASQEAIKILGTNGGGFFNANSAHPFENPTGLTNLIQMILILLIGAGLTNVFGRMIGNERQGWALFTVMGLFLVLGTGTAYWAESRGNPAIASLGVDQAAGPLQAGGNMEGKEVRFGIANTALFATVSTGTSTGAVNSMHDSFTPIGGMVPLLNMMLGCVFIGGVGCGLYGMLLYVVVAMFVAGLMVGRTPEYVGKKLEAKEVKMTMLALLVLPLANLVLTAVSVVVPAGLAGMSNPGPHGFSEVLYAFTSAVANNGSAFAGLSGNTVYYNAALAIAMFVGRFAIVVPVLAVAGSLAAKRSLPASLGTFPTTSPLFVSLLMGTIVIIGALTYFPALALGPVVEQLMAQAGTLL